MTLAYGLITLTVITSITPCIILELFYCLVLKKLLKYGRRNNDNYKCWVVVNDENETNRSCSIYDEIPILVEKDLVMNSIETFKSALMITIEKLNTMIEFLKNELEEKNLHIRTLLLRDANDGRSIDIALLNKTTQSSMETTPPDEKNFHDEIIVEFNA